MKPEDPYEAFRRLDEEWQEIKKGIDQFWATQEEFVRDFIDSVSQLVCEHFTGEPPLPFMSRMTETSAGRFRELLAAVEWIETDGQVIFESVYNCALDFHDQDHPPNRTLEVEPVRFPTYTEADLEARVRGIMERVPAEWTPQRIENLRETVRKDMIVDRYHTEFHIKLHDLLKKLALKYVPEIMDMTGNGFRYLDYLLYLYMRDIRWTVMRVMHRNNLW